MNFRTARANMVREQLIRRGIRDPRVIEAMGKVPRERFIEGPMKHKAYEDGPLPIGENQTISQPYIVAFMSEALELAGREKVLEVGTGSGYQTAVLAELAKSVFTVELIDVLLKKAKKSLRDLGYPNIHFKLSDGTLGWNENAPYDGIIVTAAAPAVPRPLFEQLDEGGKLIIPVGGTFSQELKKIVKQKEGFTEKNLIPVRFVSLVGEYGWKPE